MPPPPPAPEQPTSELEQLQFKANQTTDQSLESTRRMMALCEESKEAGIKTLVALDDQGEQLDNIEKGVDQINTDMHEAEKNLQGMEACCGGLFACPCSFNKSKGDSKIWKTNNDGKPASQTQPVKRLDDSGIPTYGGFISKITDDAREHEMEDNMGQVSTMVGNLRNMAVDMGSEIENQNQQLENINRKAACNVDMISAGNERAGKLLK